MGRAGAAARAWLPKLAGPVLLAYVLAKTDLGELAAILRRAHLGELGLGLVLTWVIVLVRAYRWHRINEREGIHLPFGREFTFYAAAFAIGAVTPGRLGELSKVHYVSAAGHHSARVFAGVLIDRLADVAWILLVGAAGSALYLSRPGGVAPGSRTVPVVVLLGGVVAVGLGCAAWRRWGRLLAHGTMRRVAGWIELVWSAVRAGRGSLGSILLLTLLSWLIQYVQGYLLAKSLGLDLRFVDVSIFMTIVGLVSLLPISVLGLGSRDITLIYLFQQAGYGRAEALSFSACLFLAVLTYLLGSSLILALGLTRIPPPAPAGDRGSQRSEAVTENPYRYSLTTRLKESLLLRLLAPLGPGERILDLGCGMGYFTRLLRARGAAVCGVDISHESLLQAGRDSDAFVIAGVATHIPFRDGAFSRVLFTDVIEHLEDDLGALREIRRVARDGATVVVSTAALEGVLVGTRLNRLFHDKPGTPEYHVRSGYSASGLSRLLAEFGIEVVEVEYSTVLLGELFIELLKLVYSLVKKDFATQADTLATAHSPLFAVYRRLVFPPLYAIAVLENALLSRWLKGHILVVKGIVRKTVAGA